jgi:hypothetical protein
MDQFSAVFIQSEHASSLIKGEIFFSTARTIQTLKIHAGHGHTAQFATSSCYPRDFV